MTTPDYTHLRELAEKAQSVSAATPDKDLAVYYIGADGYEPRVATAHCQEWGRYIAAASPAKVLALLDRLEVLEKVREAAEALSPLISLLTVRQVIEAGYDAINAAGLNPYCMREGLADGSERLGSTALSQSLAAARSAK